MNSTQHIWRSVWVGLVVAVVCTYGFGLQNERTKAQSAQTARSVKDGAGKDIPLVSKASPSPSVLISSAESDSHQVMQESWSVQQGAPVHIVSLAQTTDGFLWLGGTSGLFRFDGTRFERFHAASGDQLLSTDVISVFAPSTGGLWVGYEYGGFSFVNNGKVTNYSPESGIETGTVNGFALSPDGVIWAGTSTGLWRFESSSWKHPRAKWNAPTEVTDLGFDRRGTLWALSGYSKRTLVCMLPGTKWFRVADEDPVGSGFTEDADQMVVISPIARPHASMSNSNPADGLRAFPIFRKDSQLIVDRNHGVWIISRSPALLMRIQVFEQLDDAVTKANAGNSEQYAIDPYEQGSLVDREGNVWFSDSNGIHRFFYTPFIQQNLPTVQEPSAIAADDNGGMWVGAWDTSSPGLNHVANGKIDAHQVTNSEQWTVAYRAIDKTLWFGGASGLWHLVDSKFVQVALPKERRGDAIELQAMTADRAGGLWVFFSGLGLYRLADGAWTLKDGRGGLPMPNVISEFTDSLGRLWFGCVKNQLAVLEGDRLHIFGPNDGIGVGTITAIYGRGPQIWIGGEFGLQQFDNGHFHTITAADGDWLLGLSGIVEKANGDLWLNGVSGVFHISRAEISLALTDPSYRAKGEHFGTREGLPGFAAQIRPLPSAVEGSDGGLWFSVSGGLVRIDPTKPQQKAMAPPITILSVAADDRNYDISSPLTFPAHTSSVRIEYAAISLSDPAAVRSRVRLRETDADWHEIGTATPVTYRNLSPGHYHFSVADSDTNGLWSDKVAEVDFTILPAWYQTTRFLVFCVGALILLLWMIYQLRLKRLEHEFNVTLKTRVDERTRIARELHDTLLQSFQGLTLKFQRARNLLPDRASEAIYTLDQALDGAEEAIVEGRDAIHDLRSPTTAAKALAEEITALGEGMVAKGTDQKEPVQFRTVVEGSAHTLRPAAHTDIFRITREAIRNAFIHSQCRLIETEIAYTESVFRLRIRDDGRGIDPDERIRAERSGHWGLKGMRERAERIGGELEVWSEPGAGTEIELRVPASIAYETDLSQDSSWQFWRRKRNP
jgi:signal transduction histidine kinase/ligand-binding sensor domain-containing protein